MKLIRSVAAIAVPLLLLASLTAFAKDHGQGHSKDKGKDKHKGGKVEAEFRYTERDHTALRNWYKGRHGNLPPGLAKKDELPPGLQKQIVRRGTLPPGLRGKLVDCPREVVRFLPPPPPDCGHFFIGGQIVLVNRRTFMVMDIFHF